MDVPNWLVLALELFVIIAILFGVRVYDHRRARWAGDGNDFKALGYLQGYLVFACVGLCVVLIPLVFIKADYRVLFAIEQITLFVTLLLGGTLFTGMFLGIRKAQRRSRRYRMPIGHRPFWLQS